MIFFVGNRLTCSVAEIDEDTDGWVENVSVLALSIPNRKGDIDPVNDGGVEDIFLFVAAFAVFVFFF